MRDEFGATPLHWAVTFNDDPAVIARELAAGTDWHERNPAADFGGGTLTVIAALLGAGADPDARDGGEASLHRAAMLNNDPVAVIAAPVAAGADLQAEDAFGATPHVAAAYNPEIVSGLLAAGVDPDARDENDVTPLHMAARRPATPRSSRCCWKREPIPTPGAIEARPPRSAAASHYGTPGLIPVLTGATADAVAPPSPG